MNHQEPHEPARASMNEVVMNKQALLEALIGNKAKHDVILATAISGYWDTAQSHIEKKKKVFATQLAEFEEDVDKEFSRVVNKIAQKEELPSRLSIRSLGVDSSLDLVYPQDHSKDYDRAIRMMESSVFDEVCLTVNEFDAYVMNDWEWKKNFISMNTSYVNAIRSKGLMLSGAVLNVGVNARSTYELATSSAYSGFLCSGISNF